jgi:predicted helicase
MTAFADYVAALKKNLADGDSTEHTHRPALKTLLEACGKDITATNEPKHVPIIGAPDFKITRRKILLGRVETKDIGTDLSEMERGKGAYGEQFIRYSKLPNWILTDYLEFRWYALGEKRQVVRVAELDSKGKLTPLPDGEQQVTDLVASFYQHPALTVGTARELAQSMAGLTRTVQQQIIAALQHEPAGGWLHEWLTAFREVLIPNLDEKEFSDMFAQTLAYGLFAACIHTPPREEFSRKSAAYAIPKTNPFLQTLFYEVTGPKLTDAIAWAVDDIVELLKHADMGTILKNFGKGKGKEDPVVHFYETFLAAYDPKMREVRGVFYTPEPAVSYIVRSVDYLLKTRFKRPKGLADENTLILDPATGTATFIYFVVNVIYQYFAKQKGAWDSYVDKHLLNRVFGFELLIAPYAIAHLKLGMLLHDLGYSFRSDQRLGVYLTNTLEEAAKKSEQLFAGWIADEANAAAKIKRDDPILVVLGNPPYSGHSANRSRDENGDLTFIGQLIEDYKLVDGKPLGERQPKWLQDDYVKFIRFAQWRIE